MKVCLLPVYVKFSLQFFEFYQVNNKNGLIFHAESLAEFSDILRKIANIGRTTQIYYLLCIDTGLNNVKGRCQKSCQNYYTKNGQEK